MLDLFSEFIGTFIFLTVIIVTGNPIAIGLTLTSMIYFSSKFSDGHFNPAVTFMMLFNKKITIQKSVGYIISQLLGATLAFLLHKKIKK